MPQAHVRSWHHDRTRSCKATGNYNAPSPKLLYPYISRYCYDIKGFAFDILFTRYCNKILYTISRYPYILILSRYRVHLSLDPISGHGMTRYRDIPDIDIGIHPRSYPILVYTRDRILNIIHDIGYNIRIYGYRAYRV
jgi:hypothetical protein